MTTLNTRNFQTSTQLFAAAVQARSIDLTDFQVGAILRAFSEAIAADELWLQALFAQTLATTRLNTCFGIDVDTFCAQFMPPVAGTVSLTLPTGTPRIQAVPATTNLTFARNTVSATSPFIPVGASAKTADGSQTFVVQADPTNSAYNALMNGYYIPSNVASVTMIAQALIPGSQGNVAAGTINVLNSTFISGGVDTVMNSSSVTNGIDFESDAALKVRFQLFILQLSKGTEAAIQFAIQSIQPGLQVVFHENADPNQAVDYGMVTAYVDDGSGSPPSSVVSAANVAANSVKAAGARVGVYGATTLLANIGMTIATAAGYTHSTAVGLVAVALGNYVNSLGEENPLPYSKLSSIAYGIAGVTNVTGVTINGGTADLTPGWGVTIKAGTLSVA